MDRFQHMDNYNEKPLHKYILESCMSHKQQGHTWFLYFTEGHGGSMGPLSTTDIEYVNAELKKHGFESSYGLDMPCHRGACNEKHPGFKIMLQ